MHTVIPEKLFYPRKNVELQEITKKLQNYKQLKPLSGNTVYVGFPSSKVTNMKEEKWSFEVWEYAIVDC